MPSSAISNLLKQDHQEVAQLYQNYLKSKGNAKAQEQYTLQFQKELTKHATAEEMILYPAFEQYLGAQGKTMADEDRAQHQTVKKLLAALASTSVTDPQHREIFDELMTNLNEHIQGEENSDLPQFENAITERISELLAKKFEKAKMSIEL